MNKICLLTDYLTQNGGQENLLWVLADYYVDAPIYATIVNWNSVPLRFHHRIHTSFLQRYPLSTTHSKLYLCLMPLAIETFDFSKYDVVLSLTTLFASSAVTKPETLSISYINSPPRFLYSTENLNRYLPNPVIRQLFKPLLKAMISYDKIIKNRPDILISNSQNIQKKVKNIYGRQSSVVYPFAGDDFFNQEQQKKVSNSFVCLSRLVRWKNLDYVIKYFNQYPNLTLRIIGTGPDSKRLKKMAKPNIIFSGKLKKSELKKLVSSSQAMLMTQDEDFGIAAVEAQSLGTPVIALGVGGALETVKDGITGVFFEKPDVQSFALALDRFQDLKFDTRELLSNASCFTRQKFLTQIDKIIQNK